MIGLQPANVRDVIERATEQRPQLYGRAEFVHPEFREALLRVAGEGGAINGRRLGKWIGGHQNRIVGGLRLINAGVSAGHTRWQLQTRGAGQPRRSTTVLKLSGAVPMRDVHSRSVWWVWWLWWISPGRYLCLSPKVSATWKVATT